MSASPPYPKHDTQEYLWWAAGATAEQQARDEGLSNEQQDVRHTLEGLARMKHGAPRTAEDLVLLLAKIYCPDKLRRKYR